MCGVWTTPSDMFKHLETTEHKLAYLFRNYKMYHQTVVSETNSVVRSAMLSQFAIQIWKMEKPPGVVSNRLRSLLDRATIERIWPEHKDVLDHTWKDDSRTVGRMDVPPPVSKSAMMFPPDDSKNKVIKKEPKDDYTSNGDRRSSHSKDKDKRSSERSGTRSSSTKDKEKSRSDKESSRSSKSNDKDRSDRSDHRSSSSRDRPRETD
ncbi:hypothetical protein COOONC_24335, partial [Cooperia oncophora]